MIRVNIDLLYLANDYFWYYEVHLFAGIGYEMEDGILAVESSYQEGMLDGITKIHENAVDMSIDRCWFVGVLRLRSAQVASTLRNRSVFIRSLYMWVRLPLARYAIGCW
jgi:hypothetical protein